MKRFIAFLVTIFIITIGLYCVRIDERQNAAKRVNMTVNSFYEAVEAGNVAALLNLYLNKTTTVLIWTGVNDRCFGWENIKNKWTEILQNKESIRIFKSEETIHVSPSMQTAWISSVNRFEYSTTSVLQAETIFFSAVLEKHGSKWQFVLTHFSVPQQSAQQLNLSSPASADSVLGELKMNGKKLERDSISFKSKTDHNSKSAKTPAEKY